MKILVVNNYTKYIDDLLTLLKGHEVTISSPERLEGLLIDSYDRIILAGGGIFAIARNQKLFAAEIKLIQTTKVPLLGICLGCELLAVAFGGVLRRRAERDKGNREVPIHSQDPLFENIKTLNIYQNHIWDITELPDCLLPLVKDKEDILVIKHQDRPLYGVQFHPEMSPSTYQLITNFLKS